MFGPFLLASICLHPIVVVRISGLDGRRWKGSLDDVKFGEIKDVTALT
jgi:hypothetical protein